MIDEIFDRNYQAGRAQLNAGLATGFTGFGRTLGDSLKVLHRIEWDAPWTKNTKNVSRV